MKTAAWKVCFPQHTQIAVFSSFFWHSDASWHRGVSIFCHSWSNASLGCGPQLVRNVVTTRMLVKMGGQQAQRSQEWENEGYLQYYILAVTLCLSWRSTVFLFVIVVSSLLQAGKMPKVKKMVTRCQKRLQNIKRCSQDVLGSSASKTYSEPAVSTTWMLQEVSKWLG